MKFKARGAWYNNEVHGIVSVVQVKAMEFLFLLGAWMLTRDHLPMSVYIESAWNGTAHCYGTQ